MSETLRVVPDGKIVLLTLSSAPVVVVHFLWRFLLFLGKVQLLAGAPLSLRLSPVQHQFKYYPYITDIWYLMGGTIRVRVRGNGWLAGILRAIVVLCF